MTTLTKMDSRTLADRLVRMAKRLALMPWNRAAAA